MSTDLCRGFTVDQWRALEIRIKSASAGSDESSTRLDWECAVTVFRRRIEERFFSCIDALEKADSRADVTVEPGAASDCSTLPEAEAVVPGFAIVGLCCLLIETLASFTNVSTSSEERSATVVACEYPRGRCIRPQPQGGHLIRSFLRRRAFGKAFEDEKTATAFVRGVRDGILHEAETRRWKIWRDEPPDAIVKQNGRQWILNRTAFVSALRAEFRQYLSDLQNPREHELRKRFLKKMRDIVKET